MKILHPCHQQYLYLSLKIKSGLSGLDHHHPFQSPGINSLKPSWIEFPETPLPSVYWFHTNYRWVTLVDPTDAVAVPLAEKFALSLGMALSPRHVSCTDRTRVLPFSLPFGNLACLWNCCWLSKFPQLLLKSILKIHDLLVHFCENLHFKLIFPIEGVMATLNLLLLFHRQSFHASRAKRLLPTVRPLYSPVWMGD